MVTTTQRTQPSLTLGALDVAATRSHSADGRSPLNPDSAPSNLSFLPLPLLTEESLHLQQWALLCLRLERLAVDALSNSSPTPGAPLAISHMTPAASL